MGIGHEHADELALVVVFDEPDAARAGNDAQRVKPTVVVLPGYGPDATIHDRPEQSHTLEIGQIDCAPILNLVCRAEDSEVRPSTPTPRREGRPFHEVVNAGPLINSSTRAAPSISSRAPASLFPVLRLFGLVPFDISSPQQCSL